MSVPIAYHNARLVDPASGYDGPGGLVVQDGKIAQVGKELLVPPHGIDHQMDCQGHILAPGLIDLRVKTGEPGAEHIETIASASKAAAAGGITSLVTTPDTLPIIDDAALVEYIYQRAKAKANIRIYPAAALTLGLRGEHISEIGLMREAGAAYFSNGETSLISALTMRNALQYAAYFDSLVSCRARDISLAGHAAMHSGALAARMGLKGEPAQAEWIILQRDLILAEMTGARYCLDQASTGRSINMVLEAQHKGIRAYSMVAIHNLIFNDLDIGDYRTHFKTSPPLRDEAERQNLLAHLRAGHIDSIVSAHTPQPAEAKRLPFDQASFGAIGLETLLGALLSLVHQGEISLIDVLYPVTYGPAQLMGWDHGQLKPGMPADFILINYEKPWVFNLNNRLSKSGNSPFDGFRFQGKNILTVVGGEIVYSML